MKTVYFALLAVLLTANVAVGQMGNFNATLTSSVGWIDHTSDCATSNCWHQSWVSPAALDKVYSSNGVVLGIANNNFGYVYNPYPTNSWTEHSEWGYVYALQADAEGNIWALYNAGHCSSGGGWSLGKWNGSNLVEQTYCAMKFAIAQDGSDYVFWVDVNGTCWNNTSGTWAHCTPAPYPVDSIAVPTGSLFYVTLANGTIQKCTTICTTLPGTAALASYGTDVNIAVNMTGDVYVIGNGTSKSVYRLNSAGTGWNYLVGNGFSAISATDFLGGEVIAVGTMDSQNGAYNDVYHYLNMTPRHTRTLQTFDNCSNCEHTNNVYSSWQGPASDDGGQQIIYSPNGSVHTISSSSNLLDGFSCVENDPNCQPHAKETVVCSIVGKLLTQDLFLSLPNFGWLTGSGLVTAVSRRSVGGTYVYGLRDNCSPQGTIVEGKNAPKSAIDFTRTDTALETQSFCVYGIGWNTFCAPSVWHTFSGNYIVDGHAAIPFTHCSIVVGAN